jgi:hypothetical protein
MCAARKADLEEKSNHIQSPELIAKDPEHSNFQAANSERPVNIAPARNP